MRGEGEGRVCEEFVNASSSKKKKEKKKRKNSLLHAPFFHSHAVVFINSALGVARFMRRNLYVLKRAIIVLCTGSRGRA